MLLELTPIRGCLALISRLHSLDKGNDGTLTRSRSRA